MKKKFISKLFLTFVCLPLLLSACNNNSNAKDYSNDQRYQIYLLAVADGYSGTFEEWLELIKGADGKDGADGKSAYELYCETHPEYTKTENEWLDDLINGRLGSKEVHTVTFDLGYDNLFFSENIEDGKTANKPINPSRYGYTFIDWVDENEEHWVFNGYPITKDITLYAKWGLLDVEDILRKENLGIVPVLSEDKRTVTYGLYPQDNVSDLVLISELEKIETPESNGWYKYNDSYYAKITATPSYENYSFSNGIKPTNGTEYWFKCSPIVWYIYNDSSGNYSLFSPYQLDAVRYNESFTDKKDGFYANNYEKSEIRNWLTSIFFNNAFGLGNEHFVETSIDNSINSFGDASTYNAPEFVSNNTEDKIWLFSNSEAVYYFYSYAGEMFKYFNDLSTIKPTDYAIARGANRSWWTRTPATYYSYQARSMNWSWSGSGLGLGNGERNVGEICGICPLIQLKDVKQSYNITWNQ